MNQCSADQTQGIGSKPGSAEMLGDLNRDYQALVGQVEDAMERVEGLGYRWGDYEGGIKALKDWAEDQQTKLKSLKHSADGAEVAEALEQCEVWKIY